MAGPRVRSLAWLAPRALAAAAWAALGVGAGVAATSRLGESPILGAVLGAAAAAAIGALIDAWRGARVLGWLSGALDDPAPTPRGFWGELSLRAERALRARERDTQAEQERRARMLAAIEASPNGVLLLDANDQIDWCNGTAAAHLGLDPVRDVRQRITHLVRAPAFVAHLQGGAFEHPVLIPNPQGSGTLSILVRSYGEGLHILLTQDITERERLDATRRDFVANVSHEIRTPLTVLSGFVETMATLPLTEAERHRVLGLMGQQARRMQALVGDLLTLSRLEGSPRPPLDEWVPCTRLTQALEAESKGLSAGRHTVDIDLSALEAIAGSEPELLSAMGNLLNNAVRYTPEGGRIALKTAPREDGSFEVTVTDTGPGIAAEHLPRLSERFYRVDRSRSRDTGGTGLGLAITKHVIERHGGKLLIDSTLGVGSCFTLVLPPSRVRRADPVAAVALPQPTT